MACLWWSDEWPDKDAQKRVQDRVALWIEEGTGAYKVKDCVQGARADNTCSTRSKQSTNKAWKLSALKAEGSRWDTNTSMETVKAAVKQVGDGIKVDMSKSMSKGGKVYFLEFYLELTCTTRYTRFGGFGSWHCVYLIDAGWREGVPYFVVYDQDVTCTKESKRAWNTQVGGASKEQEETVLNLALDTERAKTVLRAMLGVGATGPGPLIRCMYVTANQEAPKGVGVASNLGGVQQWGHAWTD